MRIQQLRLREHHQLIGQPFLELQEVLRGGLRRVLRGALLLCRQRAQHLLQNQEKNEQHQPGPRYLHQRNGRVAREAGGKPQVAVERLWLLAGGVARNVCAKDDFRVLLGAVLRKVDFDLGVDLRVDGQQQKVGLQVQLVRLRVHQEEQGKWVDLDQVRQDEEVLRQAQHVPDQRIRILQLNHQARHVLDELLLSLLRADEGPDLQLVVRLLLRIQRKAVSVRQLAPTALADGLHGKLPAG